MTIQLAENPQLDVVAAMIIWSVFPMLLVIGVAYREFRPGNRWWVIILGAILAALLANAFADAQTHLVLEDGRVTIHSLRRQPDAFPMGDIKEVAITTKRSSEVLLVQTVTGVEYSIGAPASRRREVAEQLAEHLGLVLVPGHTRWVRPKMVDPAAK